MLPTQLRQTNHLHYAITQTQLEHLQSPTTNPNTSLFQEVSNLNQSIAQAELRLEDLSRSITTQNSSMSELESKWTTILKNLQTQHQGIDLKIFTLEEKYKTLQTAIVEEESKRKFIIADLHKHFEEITLKNLTESKKRVEDLSQKVLKLESSFIAHQKTTTSSQKKSLEQVQDIEQTIDNLRQVLQDDKAKWTKECNGLQVKISNILLGEAKPTVIEEHDSTNLVKISPETNSSQLLSPSQEESPTEDSDTGPELQSKKKNKNEANPTPLHPISSIRELKILCISPQESGNYAREAVINPDSGYYFAKFDKKTGARINKSHEEICEEVKIYIFHQYYEISNIALKNHQRFPKLEELSQSPHHFGSDQKNTLSLFVIEKETGISINLY